jgi:hypothetical protein
MDMFVLNFDLPSFPSFARRGGRGGFPLDFEK